MTDATRRRLPDRRPSITFDVEAFNLRFTVTASPFDDGTTAEVFIQNHKAESAAGIMASDSAIAASLALQYGCPADVLRKALSRDARGNASGPLAVALDHLASMDATDKATTNDVKGTP
jgi:ribonucleoside-diphosphate reductase alpha chain